MSRQTARSEIGADHAGTRDEAATGSATDTDGRAPSDTLVDIACALVRLEAHARQNGLSQLGEKIGAAADAAESELFGVGR